MKVKPLSRVQLFATPWTAAYQAHPSMGFSRQAYRSELPWPSPTKDLPSTIQSSHSCPGHYQLSRWEKRKNGVLLKRFLWSVGQAWKWCNHFHWHSLGQNLTAWVKVTRVTSCSNLIIIESIPAIRGFQYSNSRHTRMS